MPDAVLQVLIVDDSPAVSSRLRSLLSAIDGVRHVGLAGGVREGRRLMSMTRPDLVVLDVHMPDGSGLDLLESIRAFAATVTVVMLTNDPLPALREECLAAGADFYFDKSSEFDRVADVAAELVATLRSAGKSPRDASASQGPGTAVRSGPSNAGEGNRG